MSFPCGDKGKNADRFGARGEWFHVSLLGPSNSTYSKCDEKESNIIAHKGSCLNVLRSVIRNNEFDDFRIKAKSSACREDSAEHYFMARVECC